MFYVLRPQSPYTLVREQPRPLYVDPEDAFVERKRREYLAALEQQQQRRSYEHAVEAEEERHQTRLAALAQQERMRRNAAHRRSLPPHAFEPVGPPCASTNIVRGRYNRQREAPHCHASAPAPLPQPPRPQSEEITLDRLFAELFGHSAHNVRIPLASDLFNPILTLTHIQEPEVAARKTTQPTAVPPQAPRTNVAPAPVASTSTAPAPAAGSARAQPEPSEGHWADAVKRTRSVAAISQISRTFESLKRSFTFPAGPLVPVPGSQAPRLAYNATNAPIHAYEHALSELLTELDGVDSFGFRGVREHRKEVVVKIEKELEALEKKVAEAIAAGASPVVKSAEVVPEEPATENQATAEDKVPEDIVMEEAEVAAIVAPNGAEETTEGYDLDLAADDAATVVPAPAAPVEPASAADSPMADPGAQTTALEAAQPVSDPFAFVVSPPSPQPESTSVEPPHAQPKEYTTSPESQERDSDAEPASQITESSTTAEAVPSDVVATPAPESPSQTVLADATASSSESESEIEDAVDVTISSDSEVDVALEADGAVSDPEKDFEML